MIINKVHNLFEILPEEINNEIFSYLPSVDLIFSHSNVCKSWRRLILPIITKQYELEFTFNSYESSNSSPFKSSTKSDHNEIVEKINSDHDDDDFLHSNRKFRKTMLRKFIYQVADRWIEANLEKLDIPGVIDLANVNGDLDEKIVKQLMSELELITRYFSNFSDLKKKDEHSNEKKENVETKKEEKSSSTCGNSVFKGIFQFLGSYFGAPSGQSTQSSNPSKSLYPYTPQKFGNDQYSFKCSMSGDSFSGKTSFINCIIFNKTFGKYVDIPTIGSNFFSKTYQFSQDKRYDFQIWDVYGPERFTPLTRMHYRNVHVVFLLFDLTNETSFEHIPLWYNELKNYDAHHSEVVLIGNKTDLINGRRVNKEQAQKVAFDIMDGALYVETTNSDIKHAHKVALYSMIVKCCIFRNIEEGK
ncbi:rab family small GTPase [Naegleria gruberi]|uniref:Rab family small GTPase n=1 Tax=Naegleria gruberi TaxID=5762 RepID=D2VGZ7_NAEGR|nr:rab family small GTPase [Naegleria gruberi]EFC43894.1 rab family small GTPase [Naegleria gruberi]|eukprot:XP_002676638.1 rab family small GTPase [Naegleria gruberi strain NEG-M]